LQAYGETAVRLAGICDKTASFSRSVPKVRLYVDRVTVQLRYCVCGQNHERRRRSASLGSNAAYRQTFSTR
jgi:hypothetical protein